MSMLLWIPAGILVAILLLIGLDALERKLLGPQRLQKMLEREDDTDG